MKTFVIVAGGSGGHVFPAQSLAETLHKHEVICMTDQRGAPYFQDAYVMKLRYGSGYWARARLIWDLMYEWVRAVRRFVKQRPDAIIGFGGYPTLPVMLAGQLLRIPTVIHEQNAVMGRSNRLLQRFAKHVALGFPDTKYANRNLSFTGIPVRANLVNVPAYSQPIQDFHILVMGGSQGAKILSEVVPTALCKLSPAQQKRIHVAQQARAELVDVTRDRYQSFGGAHEVTPFFSDMDKRYTQAHLVIARSGASTVAELCVTGRPAILVPYEASLDGDQWNNALFLQKRQGCIVLSEYYFTAVTLHQLIEGLIEHPERLQELADNARRCRVVDAHEQLSALIQKIPLH